VFNWISFGLVCAGAMKETEKSLDPQLWHACAGGMVQMPPVNSKVFYFPQGHAEHAQSNLDFGASRIPIPPLVLCRVAAVKFVADPETDEVFARLRLVPLRNTELDHEESENVDGNGAEGSEKPASFAKTLTQSDANNGGGFSVPRYCAETIFPRLDYSAEPPVQTVIAKDVHGEVWKFRHIYRGTPRRHLLTTGWSSFVNQKKLVAGDSIVFLRAENGDLCVGIRRAKRGGVGGPEAPCGWSSGGGGGGGGIGPYGAFSAFLREESKVVRNGCGRPKVSGESVREAITMAANNQPFEVVYYPRANTPEFCIRTSAVRGAMRIQWCSGMRFKMPFETEDSSRISWFMGTIASVQVLDPIRWPNSPWRLLQVPLFFSQYSNFLFLHSWFLILLTRSGFSNPWTFFSFLLGLGGGCCNKKWFTLAICMHILVFLSSKRHVCESEVRFILGLNISNRLLLR